MKRHKPSAKSADPTLQQPLRVNAMAFAVAVAFSSPAALHAQNLPTGLQTVKGAVTVSNPTPTSLHLNQTSQNAGMTAQTFSIGSAYRVDVVQPGRSSVMVMNVLGGNPSNIFGKLTATGQFFLINSAGVLFAPGASVDVGGLVASTMPISYADATSGRYVFTNHGGSGSVVNQGRITALNGYVGLFAPKVVNEGVIVARMGQVALAAGNQVTLDMVGDGLIKVAVNEAALNASVMNRGAIDADGGSVLISAKSANALLDTVINTDGVIRANTISNRNGTIVLDGGERGVVSVAGTIEAKGNDAGTTGGTVKVLGEYVGVGLGAPATVDASGDAGGGTVLIGGNFQGNGPEANASRTYVGSGAVIKADAATTGNGGKVIVWADDTTRFFGSISARGGAVSGDGGFVEVSGKQYLAFNGAVDTRAPNGKAGLLLLDPTNITIQDAAGADDGEVGAADGTVAFGDGTTGAISDEALEGVGAATSILLQASNDITVNAGLSGGLTLAQTSGNSVTFQAGNDITIGSPMSTAGGSITLSANDPAGTQTGSGVLLVSGTGSLASGGGAINLTNNGSTQNINLFGNINAGSGTLTLTATGAGLNQAGAGVITAATLIATAGPNGLAFTNTNAITNLGAITSGEETHITNGNSLTLTGNVTGGTLDTAITVVGGSLNVGSQNISGTGVNLTADGITQLAGSTVNGGTGTVLIDGNANPVSLAGAITTSNATASAVSITDATLLQIGDINMTGGAGAKTTLTFTGAGSQAGGTTIQGANGALDINGGTMTLSGNNSYGGATAINTGSAVVTHANGLGNTTGATTVAAGANLTVTGAINVGESITLNGGNALNLNSTAQISGGVTLNTATSNIAVDGSETLITGIIDGPQGLTLSSGGTLRLLGNNTYGGLTTVNSGQLRAEHANALGSTASGTTVAATGILGVGNAGGLILAAEPITLDGGILSEQFGGGLTDVVTGTVTLTANSRLNAAGGNFLSITGKITGGFGIETINSGTVILGNATNDYTGATTITAGTLRLGVAGVIPDGAGAGNVSIAAPAKLDLNTFSETINGLSGSGTVDNTAAGTPTFTVGGNDQSSTFSGVIQNTAGTLALTKIGTGTLTLSGANTYAGATTISAGTLQVGNGGATGTLGTGAVTDNAALVFNRSDSVAISNAIGGTGTLAQAGAGTVTLSGANTYAGATTISAGTLSIDSDARLGTAPGVATPGHLVFNGGTLNASVGFVLNANRGIDLQAGDGTISLPSPAIVDYSGIVAGAGDLTKAGTGTLRLGGANTYGGTTISAGTLQVGIGGTSGTLGTGAVTDNAALVFDRTDTHTVGNAISGTGSLTQAGTGTVILTGANSYGTTTISAGTLQVGNGGATGTLGTGAVTDNAALVFNRSNAIAVASDISGTGTLTQSGSGTLSLSGNNSYGGLTTVSSGTTLEAASNNALGGTGTGTTVASGGTLQINGSGLTIAEPLSIAGTGNGGIGAVRNVANTNTLSGQINLSGNATISSAAGTLNLTGNLIGASDITYDVASGATVDESGIVSGVGTNLIKNGQGTLRLSGASANTYDGTTTVNDGILQAAKNGALGAGTGVAGDGTAVASGATLEIDNVAIGNERVAIAGTGFPGAGGALTGTSTASLAGPLVLTAAASVGGTGTLTLNGTTTGAFALSVIGGGDQTFANTVTVASVDVNKTGGTATFSNNVTTSGNFTTQNAGFAVALTGATNSIGGSATFLNDNNVTIGQGGGTSSFAGGLTTTGATGTNTLNGTISTTDNAITLDAVTLGSNTTLNTNATTGAGDIALGAVTAGTRTLTLQTGAVAGADVNGTSFTGGAGSALNLQTIGGTASFTGNVTADTLSVPATVANASFTGTGNTIANAFAPANTGTLTLGQPAGTQTYDGGITTTGVGGVVTLNGAIATSGDAITTGDVTLGSNSALITTAGGNPAGNNITIGNVTGGGNDLALDAGTGGVLATGTLTAIDALTLAASSVNFGGGTFGSLGISVAGALTISGNTTTTAGDVSLTGGGVTVNGGVTVDAGGGLILIDGNDGAITLTGALTTTNGTPTAIRIIDGASASLGAITTAGAGAVTVGEAAGDAITGLISQTGVINSGTLNLQTAGGNALLNTSINQLTNLGAVSLGGGALNLLDAGGLAVTGAVSAGGAVTLQTSGTLAMTTGSISGGGVSLTTTGGVSPITLGNQTVNGNAGPVTLNSSFNISQGAAGVISTTGLLTTISTGSSSLVGANTVSSYNGTNSPGGGVFILNNSGSLTITGMSSPGTSGIVVTNAGSITLTGAVTTGGGVTLTANGGLLDLGGNNVTGPAFGGVTLTGTGVTQLAGSTVNAGNDQLTVDGNGGVINMAGQLTTTNATATAARIRDASSVTLPGIQTGAAGTTTLGVGGDITGLVLQTAGKIINTGTLEVSTTNASATLTEANAITNLGAASLGSGALNLLDAGGLAVTGAVGATGGVTINTTGALLVDNTINAGAGALSLTATAGITQNAGDTLTGGAATLAGGAGVITLTEANNFTGTVDVSNSGGNAIQITDANNITVGTITAAGGGNVTVVSTAGSILNDASTTTRITGNLVTLTANTGANSVGLAGAGNAIDTDAVTFALSAGTGGIFINELNGVTLNAQTLTGPFELTAGDTITVAGLQTFANNYTMHATGASADVVISGEANDFSYTGTGGHTLALRAGRSVVFSSGADVGTSGNALNVALNSDRDGNSSGAIKLNAATAINSTGGSITLSGGTAGADAAFGETGSGLTDGHGVYIAGATLNGGTDGNITILGRTAIAGGSMNGIRVDAASLIQTAGTGTITMDGRAVAGTTGALNIGVHLFGGTISTNAAASGGSINITGIGGGTAGNDSNVGVALQSPALVQSQGNAASGTVTVTGTRGTGANSNESVFIDGDITSVAGNIQVTGNAGGTVTGGNNTGVTVAGSGLVASSGAATVTVTGTAGAGNGGGNIGVRMLAGGKIQSTGGAGGAVNVTGTGGAGSGANDIGVLVTGAGSQISSADGAITVLGTGGTGTTAGFDSGVMLSSSGQIASTGTATIDVTGFGGASVQNNRGVYLDIGGVITSGTGAITVAGTGGGSGLSNFGVDLSNSSKIESTGAATIAVTGTGTAGNSDITMTFGTNTIGGGSATSNITLTGTSQGITLGFGSGDSAIVQTSGTVTLNSTGPVTQSSGAIIADTLLGTNGSTVTLNQSNQINNLGAFTSVGGLTLVDSTSGLLVNGAVSDSAGLVSLQTTGGNLEVVNGSGSVTGVGVTLTSTDSSIDIGGNVNSGSGTTMLTATGGGFQQIFQSGGIVMGASLVAAAENGIGAGGNVLQTQVSQIQATSNSGFFGIEINNTGNVDLAGITNNSGGFIFTNAGSVTVSAPISVTRRLFMQASGASDDIALNANLTFRSAGGGGIDQIIAGRDLTQSGGTTINSNGFPVTLTAGSTTATGVMTMNGAVAVADLNATTSGGAMQLPSGSVSGNLSATSNGGPITQAGAALTVTGTSNIDAGAALINLTQGGNDFVGDVTLTNTGANAVAITDGSGGLQFAASNVGSGTLTVVSNGGAITQSGPIIQEAGAGATSFSAGANLIDLTQANDFTGTVTLSNSGAANTVQITDANTITFAPLALGGDFTVNSGGLITLAGVGNTGLQQYNNAVSLTGAFSTGGGNFNATAATGITAGGATVTVGAGVATFTGAVEGPGALAVNSGAANGETFSSTIGAVTPLASISTDAPGSVSLGGNVTTVGAQTFLDAVNAGAITLTSTGGGTISAANAASDFTGAVNISTTGTASIADGAGGLTLGTVTAGTLNAASSGAGAAITGGPMTVGTATFNAGTGPVTLTNPANDFTGAVNLTGGATQIVDSNALTLGALSTGALTVTSTGALNLGGGSIGGALVANSNNGAIGQSGALGITGTSTIAAGAGSITLNNGGNDFGGGVAASGTGAAFFDVNTFTPTNVNSGTGQLVLQANNIAAGTIGGSGVGGSGGAAIVRLISPTPVNGLVVNFPNANNVNVVGGSGPWILTGSPSLSNPLRFTGFSPTSLQITMNGIPVGSIDGAAVSAASAAQANAAAAAAGDAADIFGTDSVAQQIEFGFAGDVGNLPPIDHRLQGVGIRVPSCFNESREGEECAK